jgi:glucose-1-phosphate adenylyltransferase
MRKTMAMILSGGRGSRLHPLTEHRTKPAVPFGGVYRIIDFTLSNCINSNLRKIVLMTQYKSSSLARHLNSAWNIFSRDLGEFIEILPPQKRVGDEWYRGTADAVFQNLYHIEAVDPEQVMVLGGDHIYKMNYETMVDEHRENGADATISVYDVPREKATEFGVLQVNEDFEVIGFQEKPDDPEPMPNNPDRCLVSMGLYCFDTDPLSYQLRNHEGNEDYTHDFGHDILPAMVEGDERVFAHWFDDQNRGDERYWKDVGTVRSYYEANMDLVRVSPQFNLYDRDWPIRTFHPQYPPAKFVFDDEDRRGMAVDSIVSQGVILSGSKVKRSVLSPGVTVADGSTVEDSIIMDDVEIGPNCEIKNTIIDKRARIPEGTRLGYDRDADGQDHYLTDDGLTVVRRGYPDNDIPEDTVGSP